MIEYKHRYEIHKNILDKGQFFLENREENPEASSLWHRLQTSYPDQTRKRTIYFINEKGVGSTRGTPLSVFGGVKKEHRFRYSG